LVQIYLAGVMTISIGALIDGESQWWLVLFALAGVAGVSSLFIQES